MEQKYQIFLMLFKQLKSAIGHAPKKLKWLPKEKQEIADLCYKLDQTFKEIDRHLSNQSNRSATVPSGFSQNLEEYKSKYMDKVNAIASPLHDKYIKNALDQLICQAKSAGQSKEECLNTVIESVSQYTKPGHSFNPTIDDASFLLEHLLSMAEDIAGDGMFGLGDKHLGAMQYYENVIGVDLKGINNRWNKIPNLYISDRINKKTDKLIELYNEAARCHIFGLNVAATAMCRSLLEYILVEYYKIKEENLKKVIIFAEKKFKKIRTLNLDTLREAGNSVMHDYENKSKIEDQAVVGYLMTIRSLVDHLSSSQK
ncbi:conserved hypothetical protein [delta proteobacterium NaphS2]|nr:conserved hypothetical protein [delta proteobacterium NaphS2]